MKIAGIILAGGASARMGTHKPLMEFQGGTLLDAVIARVRPQVDVLGIDVPRGNAELYRAHYADDPVVLEDVFADFAGPLCGIVTGLEWLSSLKDTRWLASFPCDTPFLPHDLVRMLAVAIPSGEERPVVAFHRERQQNACTLWPLSCGERLRKGVDSAELISLHHALAAFDAVTCHVSAADDAFFNINTPDDLAMAEEIALRINS